MPAAASNGVSVSFVIRTYNEAEFIGRLFQVLNAQQPRPAQHEIIVVDSGSTDDTLAIAERWPVKILRIAKEKFDYSDALNLGISNAAGQLIVNLSAHAIPIEPTWLSTIVSHFSDPQIAGVYCRQRPWPDAPSREVRRIRSEFGSNPITHVKTLADQRVPFTNSAGCLRRSLWEKHPFNLPWGEDFEWATWAVANGYRIVYEPRVSVYHSHNLTCRQAARRLINGEKATDLVLSRRRTSRLTLRQAAGHACRDLKELLSLRDAETDRLAKVRECLLRAYWFWRDFRS